MSRATPASQIAIVMPVHGQAALAGEAILSLLAQRGGPNWRLIAVNDGCPDPATAPTLEGWRVQLDGRMQVITQANRGLPGARNAGIAAALADPSCAAVFFLDADNRLDPHALALFARLLDSHDDADWFYPPFDMFGLTRAEGNGGPWSLARMAVSNMCEAGSLVRRRVFEAGVRFDEDFRHGFEDWDFWLEAARAGFRGHAADIGFLRYRKRPVSMLEGAEARDTLLRARLHLKHRWLFARDALAQVWMREWPRFALIAEDGRAALGSDPARATPCDFAALEQAFHAQAMAPMDGCCTPAFCFFRRVALEALGQAGLSASVLQALEGALRRTPLAVARLVDGSDAAPGGLLDIRAHPDCRDPSGAVLADADLVMVSGDHLAQALAAGDLVETLSWLIEDARIAPHDVLVPGWRGAGPGTGGAVGALADLATRLAESPLRGPLPASGPATAPAPWRAPAALVRPADLPATIARHNGGRPRPALASGQPKVGFVLPVFRFGGAEKCAVALAGALAAQGVECHLFVAGHSGASAAGWMHAPFASLHLVQDARLLHWGGGRYGGTSRAVVDDPVLMGDLLGPLSGMDVVVNCGSGPLHEGAAALRRRGVRMASWEHLTETTPHGRAYGTPWLAVAHEAALDRILTCSVQMADWLAGQGVARARLLPLPNGPGFPADPAHLAQARAARAARLATGAPLRVGFVGRLDRQKGADRFAAIAARLADGNSAGRFVFSMTGAAVLDDPDPGVVDPCITRHPPALTPAALDETYAGLDILVLPSRAEGLPLTILEAQRAGVVPLAANVGAVAEAITHGANGLLLDPARVIEDAAAQLCLLDSDRALLTRLAGNGFGYGAGCGAAPDRWAQNAAAFRAALLEK